MFFLRHRLLRKPGGFERCGLLLSLSCAIHEPGPATPVRCPSRRRLRSSRYLSRFSATNPTRSPSSSSTSHPFESSSRPHTGVGICRTTSSIRRARSSSLLSRRGLSTASAASGMCPPRQRPDLVAEDPKSPCPAVADRALGDDAPLLAAEVWDGRLLDDVRRFWDLNLERGVVEVARRTTLDPRRHRFVDAAVEPSRVPPPRAQGATSTGRLRSPATSPTPKARRPRGPLSNVK